MPRRRPSRALMITLKWLLIPLAIGALGFYVVGPQLGSTGAQLLEKLRKEHGSDKPAPRPEGSPKFDKAPDVEVEVG